MMEFQVLARKRLRTPPTPPTPTTTRPTMQHPAHHHLRVDAVDHHEDADDDDDAYNMDAVGDRLDDDLEHCDDDDNDGDNTGEHEEDVMDPSRVNGNATRLKYQKVYTLPHYITQTHALFISPHL